MNSKSTEEKNEINRKKLSGLSMVSNVSILFFNYLIEECDFITKDDVLMNKNELTLCKTNIDGSIKSYKYDFTFKNKIIEFNGDAFHANPKKYRSDQKLVISLSRINSGVYGKTAKEIWEYDRLKTECAENQGYDVLSIWHSDVKKNKYRVLEKCRGFLLR